VDVTKDFMQIPNLINQSVLLIKKYPLRTILVLGFVHGLIYVFMIPPWWHHEEPGHFEYVWLVANRDHWPQQEYDNELRKQIAESMFASGHGNLFNVSPNSLADDPIDIGGIPGGRKPIYYWLASRPLKLVSEQPILVQLYVVRLTSFVLFLISLWLAWLVMKEVTQKGNPLRWMLPFSLALLPGYLDNMTSVHDDVIGAVVAALFLWLSIRIIKKGFSIFVFAGWVVSIVLCFYSRDTTVPLIFLAPFVPLFRLFKQKSLLIMGTTLLFVGIVVGIQLFTIQDASQWFFTLTGDASNRLQTSKVPFGNYAFSFPAGEGVKQYGQSFAPNFIKPLREKTLTLGVWIWADTPTQINLPILEYRTPDGVVDSPQMLVQIGTSPAFYTTTYYIPYEAGHTWLSIISPDSANQTADVYYDGFVLAEGQYSSSPPEFNDKELYSGTWDGKPFENMIRNPSAEHAWFGVSNIANILKARWYIDPALFLQTIQDIQGFGWYYKASISTLFQTFWGNAASEIRLLGGFTYDVLKLISLLALVGILYYVIQSPSLFKRPELLFLSMVTIIIWLPTLFRGTYWVFYFVPIVPYARYAYPAIIPTLLLINAGLFKSLQWITTRLGLFKSLPVIGYLTFMISLAIYAIFSFGGYFYPWLQSTGYLIMLISMSIVIFIVLKSIQELANGSNSE